MTAQAVVANTRAVAIASDSSVTVTNGGGSRRTFTNEEKVFPLPSPHRLALLHSGNIRVVGVPIDVLIAEWMRTLGGEPLSNVEDYVDHFKNWLGGADDIFGIDTQIRHYESTLETYLWDLRQEISKQLQELQSTSGSEEEAPVIVEQMLERDRQYLETLHEYDGLSRDWAQGVAAKSGEMIMGLIDWAMQDLPRSDRIDHHLTQVAVELAYRPSPFASHATLVFVGFGGSNVFPVSQMMDLDGLLEGRIRAQAHSSTAISVDTDAVVTPVGQVEAMNTFLRGYDYSFLTLAVEGLRASLQDASQQLPTVDEDTSDKQLQAAEEQLRSEFERLSWERFVRPMVGTVSAMAATDLARVAESFVGLQVLRQLTQAEMETVGGPIDVAIITRAEGFRWVSSKRGGDLRRDLGF